MITNLPEGQLHASSLQCFELPGFWVSGQGFIFSLPVCRITIIFNIFKKDCEDFSSSWQEENNKLMD